ncbi:VOC family protein [Devriesea agamarum]|uniref:VOC family protein n=1 Tax=Devriesea agamarum TaxID=472569 RepID=UPI00071DE8FA|nr:VOC family protein [Devriesea agamarum]
MPAPNLFLIYVSDTERSTAFYSNLFDIEPVFVSPRYVAFEVAPGVLFAVWSGHSHDLSGTASRASEVGLMIPNSATEIDDLYLQWLAKGARVVKEPHDDVFGRTFMVADPDGNVIRVSPVD